MLLALGLAAAAVAAPNARVTVTDRSVDPQLVAVDSGGSVTWRNTGRRAHRVASRTNAFAAFTLRPRTSRTVRFTRDGRHPYTVDGAGCGVVFVGVPLGPGCLPSGAGSGGVVRPPSGTRIYRYDVVLRASIKNVGYVDDSTGRREQAWERELTWSSTLRNLRFKVVRGGSVMIGLNDPPTHRPTTARVVETWDYFWHPHSAFPPNADCEGDTVQTGPYRIAVSASNQGTNFFVLGDTPVGWNTDGLIAGDCNSWVPPGLVAPEFTWEGITVAPNVGTLGIDFHRNGTTLRTPTGELLTGRGFTLDTGVFRAERTTCEGSCSGTLQIEQRYVATFTPRR